VDAFGASSKGDANLTRTLGDPRYLKAELQVQRLQRLTSDVNLLIQGQGQLASAQSILMIINSIHSLIQAAYGTKMPQQPQQSVNHYLQLV